MGHETKKELHREAKAFRNSFYFKKWHRTYLIQKDRRNKISWNDIMLNRDISKSTLARAMADTVPEDVLQEIENPGHRIKALPSPKPKAKIEPKCEPESEEPIGPEPVVDPAPLEGPAQRSLSAKNKLNRDMNPLEFAEHPTDGLNFSLFPMQRLILKAYYGIPLDAVKEIVAFKGLTEAGMMDSLVKAGKCTWKGEKNYRELVLVVGMKGGKTALAGVLACIEEYSLYKLEDFREHYGLPKGKQVFILNVAANEVQAKKTIFAEIDSIIQHAPYYQSRPAPQANQTTFDFVEERVVIQSGHSNSNALVGPLCKAVLMDELDRFAAKEEGKSSANKMYNSISRNVTPFKQDGKIISISSPMHVNGPIIKLFNQTKAEPSMLGFWLATWELNPNLPLECETLQIELRKSPEDFWRDYGAQPAHSLEKYYRDRAKIDEIFVRGEALGCKNPIKSDGTFEDWFKGNPEYNYHLHMDPSVKNDTFGIAMSHREGAYVKVDMAHFFHPGEGEIDYAMVQEFLDNLVARFPTLQTATYDVYLAVNLYQALQNKGVTTSFLRIDKAEHDLLKIETVYTGRLACYPSNQFRRELRDLNLVTGKKVDHPTENEEGGRGAKDLADSVAGSVVACLAEGEFTEVADCSSVAFEEKWTNMERSENNRRSESSAGSSSIVFGNGRTGGGSLIW